MRKDDISRLLARYLSMQDEGKEAYFDANEIEDLLDSFEESDDFTLYDGVLTLGMKLHPNHTGLQIKQCKQFVYYEKFEEALQRIETIAETNEPELDLLRLECYCSLDRYQEAKVYTEQLIANDCEYLIDIFEYTAPILGELAMHKEAIDFIRCGLKLFPDNIELKEELCYNLESTGEITEAISLCNDLIDNNPYSFDDWATLGRLYSIDGEFEKAIEAFDFALTCDDTDNEIKILKAYCLFMNENYQKAIDVYNELIGDPEFTYRVKPLIAECYLKLDNYETGYQLLRDVLENNKQYEEPASYINYLLCCAKTERLDEEQGILDKALELFPNHINLLYLKALYFTDMGQEDEAIKMLQYILNQIDATEEYINGLIDTNYQLANLFLKRNRYTEALEHFQKVLNMLPTYPMVHIKMAICYINLNDPAGFIEHISLCSDEEIKEFEGSYTPSKNEKNKLPLVDLIKEYLSSKKNNNKE